MLCLIGYSHTQICAQSVGWSLQVCSLSESGKGVNQQIYFFLWKLLEEGLDLLLDEKKSQCMHLSEPSSKRSMEEVNKHTLNLKLHCM